MSDNNKTEDLNGKRVLLAGATIFIIMPIFWYVLDKVLNGKYLEDLMLLIYVTIAAAVFIDRVFIKIIKTKNNSN